MKKMLALCMCVLLAVGLLSGCSNTAEKKEVEGFVEVKEDNGSQTAEKDDENVNGTDAPVMGRYIEEEIELPQGRGTVSVLRGKDGRFELFIMDPEKDNKYLHYIMDDKLQFQKDDAAWLDKALEDLKSNMGYPNGMITSIVYGEDDVYYALVEAYKDNGSRNYIYKSEDGKDSFDIVEIPYLDEKEERSGDYERGRYVSDVQVLENGTIALNNGFEDEVLLFSGEGKPLGRTGIEGPNPSAGRGNYVYVNGNEIIGVALEHKAVIRYDAEALQQKAEIPLDYEVNGASFDLLENGVLALADRQGIHILNEGGTLWETIADGELNSMNLPNLSIRSIFAGTQEPQDYFIYYDGSTPSFVRYVYNENVAAVPSGELTVYSLKEDATIRLAVTMFQKENMDVKVDYLVAMNGEEENSEDFVKALNTVLLAGEGADVLVLDGLPVDSYIEKGILSDMSGMIKPVEADLFGNVIEGYRKEGKLYQLPTRIQVLNLIGEQDALDHSGSLASITAYCKENPGKSFTAGASYLGLAKMFLQMEFDTFFQEDKTLDIEAFQTYLENISYLHENGCTNPERDDDRVNSISAGIQQKNAMTTYKAIIHDSNLYEEEALMKTGDYVFQPFNGSYYGKGTVGINAGGKNQELSGKFIQYLFDEKLQSIPTYDGLPLNKDALHRWIIREDKETQDSVFGSSFQMEDGTEIEGRYPSVETRKMFEKTIPTLNNLMKAEDRLLTMILDEIKSFLDGSRSAADTAQAVQTKVNTYLAE